MRCICFEAPNELKAALSGCISAQGQYRADNIYDALSELNYICYSERYQETIWMSSIPKYIHKDIHQLPQQIDGHFIIKDFHYRLKKHLDFYIYQCCGVSIGEIALIHALTLLNAEFANFIVTNSMDYMGVQLDLEDSFLKSEDISVLANFMARLLNHGFNSFGFSAPNALVIALMDCRDNSGFYRASKIYAELSKLKYWMIYDNPHKEMDDIYNIPEYREYDIYQPAYCRNYHFVVQNYHFQIKKMLDSYISLCSTHMSDGVYIVQALVEMSATLTSFIVANSDSYADLPWE